MTKRIRGAALLIALGVLATSGCTEPAGEHGRSSGALGTTASCDDFLRAGTGERDRVLRAIAAELASPETISPAGRRGVDQACAAAPRRSVIDVARRAVPGDPSTGTAEGGPEDVVVGGPDLVAATGAAVEVALSYRWDALESYRENYLRVSTPAHWQTADALLGIVEENAPRTRTVVDSEVVASGLMGQAGDEATVLVLVDRSTTNRGLAGPRVSVESIVVTMLRDDTGTWLIDEMSTSPVDASRPGPAAAAQDFVAVLNSYSRAALDPQGRLTAYADDVRAASTARLHAELEASLGVVEGQLAAADVSSTFEPLASAVESVEQDGDVSVLVAGTVVRTIDGREGQPLPVRLRVDVESVDDRWLVDDFSSVS